MGEPYLLPAIAAVVVGGTSILGGSGKYIGTIAGVIIIRLLDSALNIVQVPPAMRDITFGLVILVDAVPVRTCRESPRIGTR